MKLLYFISVLVPFIVILISSLFMTHVNDKTLFFGVRLPLDFKLTDELKNIKAQYRKRTIIYLTLVFIISSCSYFIVPYEFSMTSVVLGIALYSFIGIFNFRLTNKQVSQIKKRDKWSGYSKNIVVVDLDYRNSSKKETKVSNKLFLIPFGITIITAFIGIYSYNLTKNQMIPGVFGANGIINGYIKRGDIISIWEHLMPLLFQIVMLIILYFSCILVVKSKQIINGGEVESLKAYNRKIKNVGIYYTALISTIISIFIMGMYIKSIFTTNIMVIVILIFSVITLVLYSIYYQKIISHYKGEHEVKDGSIIINRDDDKNFAFGMFYNNPGDPSLFVPKRVGVGYDFNYGNLKIRIGVSIVSLVMVCILGFVSFVLPFDMKDKNPIITENQIIISGMYEEIINKDNISQISLVDALPNNLERTNGADIITKLLGKFTVDNTYKAKLYIGNSKGKVIKILKKDGSLVYINHTTKESTEKLFNKLNSYIKS